MIKDILAKRKTTGGMALALLALLFIGLIVLVNYGLRGLRADLTENNQYTLAQGTRNILKSIKEPINLYYYFSQDAGEQAPMLKIYANRVRELLEELAARSNGKLKLHVIDPEPFSEEEDRANELGLTAVPLGQGGGTLYFGLAGTNSTDGKAAIPLFQPEKEEFLEYDVVKLIHQLTATKKPVVGLLTTLPMMPDYQQMQMLAQQTGRMPERMPEPWAVLSQLHQLFEVKTIETGAASIDKDIDVLMLVHPKNLSDATLLAIDQFIVGGGRAIIFVDPRAEADPAGQQDNMQMYARGMNDPYQAMMAPRDSNLPQLFKAWGVEYNPREIVGDLERGLTVSMRQDAAPVRHIGILGLTDDSLNRKDVVTGTLGNINVATVGSFKLAKDSKLKLEPLLTSSTQSGFIPAERVMMMGDPSSLRDGFKPSGHHQILAGRLTGIVKSAFPDKAAIKQSAKPANIILVGDADMLADMLWIRSQNFFGQRMAQAFAANGDFVFNAIDNLAGSNDLISIRGRANFVRPFTRVEQIKIKAEDRFRAKEKELEEQLRATEQKLTDLSNKNDPSSALILTPEQEAEIERFRDEKLRIRKELREVRHGLDKDIESLGRTVRIVNIGLVPLLLSILALAAVAWRRRRAHKV